MTRLFFLLLCPLLAFPQQLKVLSAKDKSPVPFALASLKAPALYSQQVGGADGGLVFAQAIADSVTYQLQVRCIGFNPFYRSLSGRELKKLDAIYLSPDSVLLDEVVVTSQYRPVLPQEAVQKIRLIDREKIDQMGAVNLRDVLSNQMNVRLQQDNILGAGMTLQGLGGENVKLLIDGVPMIGRLNGNIDLSQVNLNDVERIELIEGPLSVQYGTNALAGTINIITRKSVKKKTTLSIAPYYESIGTYNLSLDAGFRYKNHSFRLNGGRNYFDGWKAGEAPFELPRSRVADSLRVRQWKPKEQYFAGLGWYYTLPKGELGIKSAVFNEKIINRGYPRAPYGESTFDDYYYTRRLDNSVSLKHSLGRSWSVNALATYNYFNRVKTTVYKDLSTLEETLSPNSSDQDTSSFTLFMSRASFVNAKPFSKLGYELGYDLNYESALGKRIDRQLQYMGDYAAFATMEYRPLERLNIKPGLRYSYNTAYSTPLVPSLNMKWDIQKNHALRGSYARGFRAPSLKELYFLFVDINHNIIGNQELKAEKSDNFSLSYSHNRTVKKGSLKLDLAAFYNNVFNLISLAQVSSTQYSYINVGRYKTMGGQLTAAFNSLRLSLQAGFNYTGRYNQLSESASLPGFSYSPEAQLNGTYKFIRIKSAVSVFYKYTGKLPGFALSGSEVVQTTVSAYSMVDLTANKSFMKEKLVLTLGCKNLLDVTNLNSTAVAGGAHSASSTSMPLSTGRNYFIKLALNLQQ